jgi:hypothetical protein
MMATDRVGIAAITFTVACAALYVICTEVNLPAVTYHPVIGEIDLGWKAPRNGPVMYWYGWMLTSFIGAAIIAAVAAALPEKWTQRLITFLALAAIGSLIVSTVALFIYDKAPIEIEILKSRWVAVAGAVVLGAIGSLFAPRPWNERLSPVWAWIVPAGALVVLASYLVPFFTH